MQKVTIRRTFNIGNYESLSLECTGEDNDLNIARLKATKDLLTLTQQELIRIYGIQHLPNNTGPWTQINFELEGVNSELSRH